MHTKQSLNMNWQFHLGEIGTPFKTAKKAGALGGLTAPLPSENASRLPISAGGDNFLKLIAQGNVEQGLQNLAGTQLVNELGAGWQSVTLPHDWKVAQPFVNDPQNLMSGSKPDSVGYYRRTFNLVADLFETQRIVLHFEGIMRMADIWLNGVYLAHNNSGYTAVDLDITELAHYGKEGPNVLLVRVDTTTGPEGWWYEGAGIYKPVWLEAIPLVSIDTDGTYIYTKKLNDELAIIQLECQVNNASDRLQMVKPVATFKTEKYFFEPAQVEAHSQRVFKLQIKISRPKVWTPEKPNLYSFNFKIASDQITKNIGIHTFDYKADGFYLNGQRYELRGVCEHQDFGGVGIALNQDIVDYKVTQMKKMGVNAWRSAHHFASKELLNACDRLGMLVINENRLLESSPWRVTDLEKMVRKSRSHASIAFWSVANEELIGNTSQGSRIAKKLVQTIKKSDHEHLVISAELLNPTGKVDAGYLDNYDVLGVNYPEAGVMGAGAALIKQKYPKLSMMSTENASYFSTRGVYRDNAEKCQCNNFGSMYSMVLPGKQKPGAPGVGGTAHPEEVMAYLKSHSDMGGVFLWTAFDYYGEPSPFGWPGVSSQFGIADICGFAKDYYYYYQAHWTNQPMVHVLPTWNRAQLDIDEAGNVQIRAFSNAESVELIINGYSFGCQKVVDCEVNWKVPYQAGILQVHAFNGHHLVSSDQQVTSEDTKTVNVTELYHGQYTSLYGLSAQDHQGRWVPVANEAVSLKVRGGKIIGVGNGDPANIASIKLDQVSLFNGRALVIVDRQKADIVLQATLS